jgi:hypothetical protein
MQDRKDRIAKGLMIMIGVYSLIVTLGTALRFAAVPPDRIIVDTWRMLAFPVFGGLFILLGLFPRRMPGLWEMAFYHKVGVAIFLFIFTGAQNTNSTLGENAFFVVFNDLFLATVITSSYLLTKGWKAWHKGEKGFGHVQT